LISCGAPAPEPFIALCATDITQWRDRETKERAEQMPRSLLGWIIVGLIAGWLAGKVTRGAGFGIFADIFLGLIGAVLGGWIFGQLGIHAWGFLGSLAAATVGAVVLVAIAGLFGGNSRR
jgi:uncharacterized membrane protein YeaQ/YmgE (transglycosylase-associated protein family)